MLTTEMLNSEGGIMGERNHIELPKDKIASFCKKHHILKLSLFGSVLRDDFLVGVGPRQVIEFMSQC